MSRICAAGDEQVNAFTSRPLDAEFPCLSLDATYCKVRVAGVGDSESEAFWTEFLRSLRDRGLFTFRVQLVICDAHRGLVTASGAVLHGSAWRRCRVHFLRNVLAKVGQGDAGMIAAAIPTIFAQPTAPSMRVEEVASVLEPKFPAVAAMITAARADITASADLPEAHWRKVGVDQPAGATEQGDRTQNRRRRHLPQPVRPRPAPRSRAHRSRQPVESHRPPLTCPRPA